AWFRGRRWPAGFRTATAPRIGRIDRRASTPPGGISRDCRSQDMMEKTKAHPDGRAGFGDSGIRESNPSHSLGKAGPNRYTNPANIPNHGEVVSVMQRPLAGIEAMTTDETRSLLEQLCGGQVTIEQALARLRPAATSELGFATVDLQRRDRCGFPEVV